MSKGKSTVTKRMLPVLVASAVATAYVQPLWADPPEESCIPSDVVIIWSDPADGYVDPRQVADDQQCPDGIRTISVEFSDEVDLSTHGCIEIITTGGDKPSVASVTEDDGVWTIELSEPIPAGETTALAFGGGAAGLVIHSHPGDVNLDGITDDDDRADLESAIAASSTALTRYDYNRDGQIAAADTNRLIDFFVAHPVRVWDTWIGGQLQCCCGASGCSVSFGFACGTESTATTCPCRAGSCSLHPE